MPFVRAHGKQLAIVHGFRRDGKVVQEVLFTLYSRAEAREAVGAGAHWVERMVEVKHPTLRVDWDDVRAQIAAAIDHLPEDYDHRDVRLRRDFRAALVAFARQILVADPQDLDVAAELLEEQRASLELVRGWMDWRLKMARERTPSRFSQDNPFLWRHASAGDRVPHEADEELHTLYEEGKLDRVDVEARLLVEAFPNYADGWNLLGLVALDRDDIVGAIDHFRKTMEIGRTQFPKRVAKDAWWTDHDTRPYMRGVRNLTLALQRAGRFEEALEVCEELDRCQDDLTASWRRAELCLNLGRYEEALGHAGRLTGLWPEMWYQIGFALTMLRRPARPAFVQAILHHPRVAQRLVGKRVGKVMSRAELEGDRVHEGLQADLAVFFKRDAAAVVAPVRKLLAEPGVAELLGEIAVLEAIREPFAVEKLREIRERGV